MHTTINTLTQDWRTLKAMQCPESPVLTHCESDSDSPDKPDGFPTITNMGLNVFLYINGSLSIYILYQCTYLETL